MINIMLFETRSRRASLWQHRRMKNCIFIFWMQNMTWVSQEALDKTRAISSVSQWLFIQSQQQHTPDPDTHTHTHTHTLFIFKHSDTQTDDLKSKEEEHKTNMIQFTLTHTHTPSWNTQIAYKSILTHTHCWMSPFI